MNKKHKNQSSMNHQMINTVCFNNIRINNKVHMIIRGNDMKVLLPHITDELLKHNIKKNVIHSPNIYTHTVCVCACVCVCVCVYFTCINWYLAIDSGIPMLISGDFSLPLPPP